MGDGAGGEANVNGNKLEPLRPTPISVDISQLHHDVATKL